MLVYFDIDGVLADCTHRIHYLQGEKKDHDGFYSEEEVMKDVPIQAGIELFLSLFDAGNEIIFLTGRPYRTEEYTRRWLRQYVDRYKTDRVELLMRKDGDHRHSEVIKPEIIKKQDREGLMLFIDDDPKNVKAVEQVVENCCGLLFKTDRI